MCTVECKCNADDRLESIKENLRELTANELFNTALKLSMENQELQAKIAYQDRELREAAGDHERAYLNGKTLTILRNWSIVKLMIPLKT